MRQNLRGSIKIISNEIYGIHADGRRRLRPYRLGKLCRKGHAAVDPDVIPLGSIVYIEGYGYAICDDIGGAIQGYVIDVGVDNLEQAYQWGSRDNITVYLIS